MGGYAPTGPYFSGGYGALPPEVLVSDAVNENIERQVTILETFGTALYIVTPISLVEAKGVAPFLVSLASHTIDVTEIETSIFEGEATQLTSQFDELAEMGWEKTVERLVKLGVILPGVGRGSERQGGDRSDNNQTPSPLSGVYTSGVMGVTLPDDDEDGDTTVHPPAQEPPEAPVCVYDDQGNKIFCNTY